MHPIKRQRAEKRLSLRELGRRSGVPAGTISGIERGQREPQIRTLAKVADALNVDVGELIEEPILPSEPTLPEVPTPPTGQPSLFQREPELSTPAGDERRVWLPFLASRCGKHYDEFAVLFNSLPEAPTEVEVERAEAAINTQATVFFNFLDDLEEYGIAEKMRSPFEARGDKDDRTSDELRDAYGLLGKTLTDIVPQCAAWIRQHGASARVVNLEARRTTHERNYHRSA